MGYYCTVPQCTSLAGKTKNVKFHRFPRDVTMADRWNNILKRGKPYTKYSKVCSLHFTQADYNVTTMGKNKGQWKTLSKDAVPSQNLPKLNPDGTVMVIRKSRTIKYKDGQTNIKKELDNVSEKICAWPTVVPPVPAHISDDPVIPYRMHNILAANLLQPQNHTPTPAKRKKQDAFMQTDPIPDDEEIPNNNSSSESASDLSYNSESDRYRYSKESGSVEPTNYELPKDYTKTTEDYVPQTNEEYNKEAEKYALERKPNYEKTVSEYTKPVTVPIEYEKPVENYTKRDTYEKMQEVYQQKDGFSGQFEQNEYEKNDFAERQDPFVQYQTTYVSDAAEILRNQQHNLQMLQQQRGNENQNFFNENHIKQEIDLSNDDDKYLSYERHKATLPVSYEHYYETQVKTEPATSAACESVMQSQSSPYYQSASHGENPGGYYVPTDMPRPGPELLIAKQNALAAHTQLWQNSMKRPFFYSENTHYNGSQLLHNRYEDLTRILNP